MVRSAEHVIATCFAVVLLSSIEVGAVQCQESFSDFTCAGGPLIGETSLATIRDCQLVCALIIDGETCCQWDANTRMCKFVYTHIAGPSASGKVALLCAENGIAISPTQSPVQSPTQTPTQAPTQTPTQAPTQAPTQTPTTSPTSSPTTPCSTIVQTFHISESRAVCGYDSSRKSKASGWSSWSTAFTGKRADIAQCYADGLGHALVGAFSSASGLPGAVNGIFLTMDDIVESITVIGADGPSDSTRTGVAVVVEYKPESPINHIEFAAAANLFATGTTATLDFCHCSSQVSVTYSSLAYDIESPRGSTKKTKKCKGGFKTPKSKKEKSGFLMAITQQSTPSNAAVASGFVATAALVGVALARRARARRGYEVIGEDSTTL